MKKINIILYLFLLPGSPFCERGETGEECYCHDPRWDFHWCLLRFPLV